MCATTSTWKTAPRPTCCWPNSFTAGPSCAAWPSTSPIEIQVTVLEPGEPDSARRWTRTSSPTCATKRRNEIRHQYLSASRARTMLDWTPLSPSTKASSEPSPGTGSFWHDGTRRRTAQQILELVAEYCAEAFAPVPFSAGRNAGARLRHAFSTPKTSSSLVDASLDFWLTTGRFAAQFESEFAALRCGVRERSLVNSGSSANLLALSALTSPKLGDRRLSPATKSSRWPPASRPPSIRSSRTAWSRSSST